jgi:hypothetical protein
VNDDPRAAPPTPRAARLDARKMPVVRPRTVEVRPSKRSDIGARLRSALACLLAAGSFVVLKTWRYEFDGAISERRVIPVGLVAAPLCWAFLLLNRSRLTGTERLAGVVAGVGAVYCLGVWQLG